MNKTSILFIAIIVVSTVCVAQGEEKKLGVSFDLTYASRWLSRGSEVYSEDGALFGTVTVDLYGTGFGVAVTNTTATGSGWVDKSRNDYQLFYGSTLFDEKIFKTKYKAKWEYRNWYDRPREIGNTQVLTFAFSWPKLLGNGLVPKYIVHYDYPAGSGYNNRSGAGWIHRFGVGYKLGMSELKEPLNLSAEIAYRDGTGGGTTDHDWSHATLGVSTLFKISENLSLIPGLFHQISMDDSVATRDITYTKISLKYKF